MSRFVFEPLQIVLIYTVQIEPIHYKSNRSTINLHILHHHSFINPILSTPAMANAAAKKAEAGEHGEDV
jgi:hypothetical protein